MRKMKDSGVEWIGEIPEEWEVVRFKSCVLSRDGGAWGDEPQNDENDIICLRIADFDYSKFCFKENCELTIRNYKRDVIDRLKLKKGDILIEKSGGGDKTPVGRAVVFNKEYDAVYANFMDRIRVNSRVSAFYFLYYLAVFYSNQYVWNYIKQSTGIQNLDLASLFANERIALPNIKRQEQIVSYLEKKCSKIDFIISKQEQIIEKLKEYKLSLITETVTKGLDLKVEMKDSGVEWIGKIPLHWKSLKIKDICSFHNGDRSSNYPSPDEFVEEGVPFIGADSLNGLVVDKNKSKYITEEKYSSMGGLKIQKGDILYTLRGSTIGKNAISDFSEGTVASSLMGIRVMNRTMCSSMFLYFYLNSLCEYLQRDICINGSTAPNLSAEDVKQFIIMLPDAGEQEIIANYLYSKCMSIDNEISERAVLIELYREYKKSLIYEVVTGKKEV